MKKILNRFMMVLSVLLLITNGFMLCFLDQTRAALADYKLRQEMEGDWRYIAVQIIEGSSPFVYVVDIEKLDVDEDNFMVAVWLYLDPAFVSQEKEEELATVNLAALEAASIPGSAGAAIMYCKIQEAKGFSGPVEYAEGFFGITGPTEGMGAWAEAGGSFDALKELHEEGTVVVWASSPFTPPQEHYTKLPRPSTEVPLWDD